MQAMMRPGIKGIEYQQGTLAGHEVRQYLLEKFDRTCIDCGITGVPLQIERVVPRAKSGSDRISNLGIGCEPCNRKKGTMDLKNFLKKDLPKFRKISAQRLIRGFQTGDLVMAKVTKGKKQGTYVGTCISPTSKRWLSCTETL